MGEASPAGEPRSKPGGPIILAPPDASWADAFSHEASAVSVALSVLPMELHHIGSTAIPGIVAKPVIDMLGVVPAVEALDARAHLLGTLGYEAMGEFGISGRRYFRKDGPDGSRTHQLHAFAAGSAEIRLHLNFRDYLRALPVEAVAHAARSRSWRSGAATTCFAYSDGKTEFIRAVDQRAEAWRRRTECGPGDQHPPTDQTRHRMTADRGNDPHDLQRFVDAQAPIHEQALAEIRAGLKRSHWMWYVFPQYAGLGSSATSREFAIGSIAEAKAYLQHDVLGPRLADCSEALLVIEGRSAHQILGADDLKLRSCATLFAHVSPPGSVFHRLLGRFFEGQADSTTLTLIERESFPDSPAGGSSGPT